MVMMRVASVGIIVALLFARCSAEQSTSPEPQVVGEAELPAGQSVSAMAVAVDSVWAEQKLVRDATVEIEVASVELALEAVELLADRRDALVADTEVEQLDDGARRAALSIRVPATSFEAVLSDLVELGEVEQMTSNVQDITKSYADLETRLSVKRETEGRLRALLASRTGNLDEVLQVERELSRVIGEIEQLEGERRYYDHRVAVSTIRIELYESRAGLRASMLSPVGDALAASLSVMAVSASALIYVMVFAAPWLAVGIPIGLWVGKRRARRATREIDNDA